MMMMNYQHEMKEQDRTSPNNINTISSRQVKRIKKNINQGIIT